MPITLLNGSQIESSSVRTHVLLPGTFTSSISNGIGFLGTSSYSQNSNLLDGLDSTVFITTGSNTFIGNQIISGSLTVVTGSGVELLVTNTGVTLGNALTDIHNITGSLRTLGGITGSLFGTASWASNAVSSSFASNVGPGTSQSIALFNSTNSISSSIIFQSGSNIGIGTTTPDRRLYVVGTSTQDGIRIDAPVFPEVVLSKNSFIRGYLGIAGNANGYAAGTLADSLVLRSENTIHLVSNGSIIGLTVNSGSIGIGTTVPSASLHISASGTTNDFLVGSVTIPKLIVSASGNVIVNGGTLFADAVNNRVGINTTASLGASLQVQGNQIISASANQSSSLDIAHTWSGSGVTYNSIKLNVTDTTSSAASLLMDLQVGGTSRLRVDKVGRVSSGYGYVFAKPQFYDHSIGDTAGFQVTTTAGCTIYGNSTALLNVDGTVTNGVRINSSIPIGWTNGHAVQSAPDLTLFRDAADALAQRRSANPQTYRIYNTFTDASNFERGKLEWSGSIFQIGTEQSGSGVARDLALQTSGSTRMFISSSGNVGIGTITPTRRLEIAGDGLGNPQLRLSYAGGISAMEILGNAASAGIINFGAVGGATNLGQIYYSLGNNSLSFFTNANQRVTIDSSGRMGIGTTAPSSSLHVQGNVSASSYTSSISNAVGFFGTASWAVSASVASGFAGTANRVLYNNASNVTTTSANLTFDGTNLTVGGQLNAATKSFLINHRTKPGKKLVYGVAEGPEHSVFIRGRLKGTNTIVLPNEWDWLVDLDSITVQLTPIGKPQKLYVKSIDRLYITVENGGFFSGPIDCYYFIQATRKDVDPLQTVV